MAYDSRTRERMRLYVEGLRAVRDRAKARPCADCGVQYARQYMHFDHRPGEVKAFDISAFARIGAGTRRLLDEIAKCDVVCASCHERRTSSRRACPPGESAAPLPLLFDDD